MKLFVMSAAKRATRCRCVENANGCSRVTCGRQKRVWGANPSKFAGTAGMRVSAFRAAPGETCPFSEGGAKPPTYKPKNEG